MLKSEDLAASVRILSAGLETYGASKHAVGAGVADATTDPDFAAPNGT